MTKTLAIPDEVVISKIYLIRNHKVMLDIIWLSFTKWRLSGLTNSKTEYRPLP